MEIKLTTRELQILRLAGAGYTSRMIARILCINYRTVETHKENAFQKIGAFSLAHALVLAHQLGMLDVGKIEPINIRISSD